MQLQPVSNTLDSLVFPHCRHVLQQIQALGTTANRVRGDLLGGNILKLWGRVGDKGLLLEVSCGSLGTFRMRGGQGGERGHCAWGQHCEHWVFPLKSLPGPQPWQLGTGSLKDPSKLTADVSTPALGSPKALLQPWPRVPVAPLLGLPWAPLGHSQEPGPRSLLKALRGLLFTSAILGCAVVSC